MCLIGRGSRAKWGANISRIEARPDMLVFVVTDSGWKGRIPLEPITGFSVSNCSISIDSGKIGFYIANEWGGGCPGADKYRALADAIMELRAWSLERNPFIAQATFDEAASQYREAATKPELPEEARRYKVQAEGSVRDKSFDDAAEFYDQALALAPWWPEGRFNRALVLSEIEVYSGAVSEMRRYLALVPDAANARAAQDKIYDWERRAAAVGKPVASGAATK